MTKTETLKLLAILKVAYPMFYKDYSKEEAELVAELWMMQFKDYTYVEVANAVNSFISSDTKGFPPVIGVIKEKLVNLYQEDLPTEQEAWNMVYKAVCRSIHDSEKEFAKLPATVQRVVGSPSMLKEWAMTNTDEVNTVIASNFMRSYKARAKAEKEEMLLPNEIKTMIQARNKVAVDSNVDKLVLSFKTD